MGVSAFVANRYLLSNRENRFFSWIAVLSVLGVSISVAALIVVWSVINGFEKELQQRFLAANAHILAYRFPHGLINHDRWAEVVQKDFGEDILGISPFVHYETMAQKDALMHSILIRGIAPKQRDHVQSLRSLVRPPEALDLLQNEIDAVDRGEALPEVQGIILGIGLQSLLGASVGDTVKLVAPDKGLGVLQPFKIIGVYDSGLKHYDNRLGVLSLSAAQAFFDMETRVTGLEIGLKEAWDSQEIAERMSNKYSISIREWQSFNKPLFEAMKMERVVILAIVVCVMIVAGFNILSTMFVSVSQKQRDISILKALGASNRQIASLFVLQGTFIGVAGNIVGVVLALLISMALERYQFVDLPDLYLLATLPMTYNWKVYLSVCVGATLISVVAGLLPALMASRVDPAAGFRQGVEAA